MKSRPAAMPEVVTDETVTRPVLFGIHLPDVGLQEVLVCSRVW